MNAIWYLWLKPFRNGKQKNKNIHFQKCEQIKNEAIDLLVSDTFKDILAPRKARNLFKKRKLIFKMSAIWFL